MIICRRSGGGEEFITGLRSNESAESLAACAFEDTVERIDINESYHVLRQAARAWSKQDPRRAERLLTLAQRLMAAAPRLEITQMTHPPK